MKLIYLILFLFSLGVTTAQVSNSKATEYIAGTENNIPESFDWSQAMAPGYTYWAAHFILSDQGVIDFQTDDAEDGLVGMISGFHTRPLRKTTGKLYKQPYITYTNPPAGVLPYNVVKSNLVVNKISVGEWAIGTSTYGKSFAVAVKTRPDGRKDVSVAMFIKN